MGFASAGASRDPDAAMARVGELHTIYVHPDRWGTGTGGRLHDAAMRELARRGFGQVSLWVLDSNTRARQFYERRGWTPDGTVKHDERGGTPILEVRYRRALAAGREWATSGSAALGGGCGRATSATRGTRRLHRPSAATSLALMLELVVPALALEAAWREAHAEWGPGAHEDGFGLQPSDDVASAEGFAEWVSRLHSDAARCTYRWILEGGSVLGGIALGHRLDDFRLHARGQVGFGVRPSARSRGVATWALGQMLNEARATGLVRVLLVCADGNVGSAKTIERCGGVLEDMRLTDLGLARRYWIDLDAG